MKWYKTLQKGRKNGYSLPLNEKSSINQTLLFSEKKIKFLRLRLVFVVKTINVKKLKTTDVSVKKDCCLPQNLNTKVNLNIISTFLFSKNVKHQMLLLTLVLKNKPFKIVVLSTSFHTNWEIKERIFFNLVCNLIWFTILSIWYIQ